MTTDTTKPNHPHPISGAVAAGIAELWRRWNLLIDRYHAMPEQDSKEALYLYGSAKIVALCLVSIRARHIDDTQPKTAIALYYQGCSCSEDDSHIDAMVRAAIEADTAALMPPLDRELH